MISLKECVMHSLAREMRFLLSMELMLVGNHHLMYHLCYKALVKLLWSSRYDS